MATFDINSDIPPNLDQVFFERSKGHQDKYGIPFNRSSAADPDMAREWAAIEKEAEGNLAQWNKAHGTNLAMPPSYAKIWNDWNNSHIQAYGIPMDRPWGADADASRAKENLDKQYQDSLSAYNQQYGTQLEAEPTLIGPNAQFTSFVKKPEKKGFLGGSALGTIAGIALAPYTGGSSLAMGALGGAVGGGLQSGSLSGALKGGLLGAAGGGLYGGLSGAAGAGASAGGAGAGAGTVAAGGAMDAGIGLEAVRNSFLGLPAAGGAAAPFAELGRQAGFADTLRNVGLGQALQTGLPASLSSALNLGGAANTARGFFAPQQDQQLGWRDLLGLGITGAQTYIGYNEAQDRADAANKQSDLARQIYETEQGYRLPFIQDATNILQNPNDYFNRPDVKGSVDATLRGLSANVGNPFGNPTALAKSAAYNLGGYQNALNSATGRAGIGNAQTIGGLGGQYGNSIMNTANANAGPGAALSYGLGGLGSLLSTRNNPYINY